MAQNSFQHFNSSTHFSYYAETWHFAKKRASDKLEKINDKALRFVYRDNSFSYEMLLKRCGQQTLSNQRLATILTTVHKVVNKQRASTFNCHLLKRRESHYNLREFQLDAILALPKVNTTKYGLKSIRCQGPGYGTHYQADTGK